MTEPIRPYVANNDEKTWAAVAHAASFAGLVIPPLGFVLGPLIVWLAKRDNLPFVDDQGKEAVNFQLTLILVAFLGLLMAGAIAWLFLPLFFLLGAVLILLHIGSTIVAIVRASEGRRYRHPLCLRFLK
ncbi:MAG: DUF4870 domain-containing protein [Planctomycetota bacterium]